MPVNQPAGSTFLSPTMPSFGARIRYSLQFNCATSSALCFADKIGLSLHFVSVQHRGSALLRVEVGGIYPTSG